MRINSSDSPFTITSGVDLLIVDASAGRVIVNLEDASSATFRRINIIKDDFTDNPVELRAPVGNTITGESKTLLTNPKQSIGIVPDQNEWYKL